MKHLNASNALPSLALLLLLQMIILIFQTPTTTGAEDWETSFGMYDCSDNSFTSGSQFESNIVNDLLPILNTNGSRDGFIMVTFGEVPDKVYGLAQCRGDISEEDCRSCLKIASVNITHMCPNKKRAVRRLVNCLMRYSDISFFNKLDTIGANWTWGNPIPNPGVFNQRLEGLFTNLTNDASSIPSRFKTGSTMFSDLSKIYGLVECTQDLSTTDCLTCLQNMFDVIPNCCSGAKGVWITSYSCQILYRDFLFFRLSSPPPPPPPPPPTPPLLPSPTPVAPLPQQTPGKSKGSSSPKHIGIIVVPIIIGSLLISVALCVYLAKRKTRRKRRETTEAASITGKTSVIVKGDNEANGEGIDVPFFSFTTILVATDNFKDSKKLGEGGFGPVYKGELPDGQQIAVKRLSKNSGQGLEEFKNEVVLLHKLQHRNLVSLLGFCLEGIEKLLIYEYVPNRSLDKHLFGPIKGAFFDWGKRYKIIGGIARGLLYLHEDSRLRIIHRDLKAANILLDGEMDAKIADFGMARLFGSNQTQGNTSRIGGTFGYIAPEYALHGLFSVKSDVFSFGVLVLEIVSGKRITSFHKSYPQQNLLSYAWNQWREGTGLALLDPALSNSYSEMEVMKSLNIGLLCVQEKPENRPTMSSVVSMLNSNSVTMASPSQPAFFTDAYSNMSRIGEQETDLYKQEPFEPNHSVTSSSKSDYASGMGFAKTTPR